MIAEGEDTAFFFKETSASTGFGLDANIYAVCIIDNNDLSTFSYRTYKLVPNGTVWEQIDAGNSVAAGGAISFTSTEPIDKSFSFAVNKVSETPSVTGSDPAYSLENAVYQLSYGAFSMTDRTVITQATAEGTAITSSEGKLKFSGILATGETNAYYIWELTPSAGFGLDPYVYAIQIIEGIGADFTYNVFQIAEDGDTFETVSTGTIRNGGTVSMTSVEPVSTGYWKLNLSKISGDSSLTNRNTCYSLEGAEYQIWLGKYVSGMTEVPDDAVLVIDNEHADGIHRTDANGEFSVAGLKDTGANTAYFIKETKASNGYKLDPAVYIVRVIKNHGTINYQLITVGDVSEIVTGIIKNEGTITITSSEPPLNDPFTLHLYKMDADTGEAAASGSASLEGAIFEVDYYDNFTNNKSGNPVHKWFFATNEEGKLVCDDESFLVVSGKLPDGTEFASDALFRNGKGKIIYPLGTYTIKEVTAPDMYQLKGTMTFTEKDKGADVTTGLSIVLRETFAGSGIVGAYDGDEITEPDLEALNLSLNVYDEVYKGSVKVFKSDSNTTHKVPLKGVQFKLEGDDGFVKIASTDGNGEILFADLIPQHYVLTETATIDGYSLLKDNIDINIPIEKTSQEVKDSGADRTKAVYDAMDDVYRFFDQTYEIGNSASFVIPATGGEGVWLISFWSAALMAASVILIIRKRKTTC